VHCTVLNNTSSFYTRTSHTYLVGTYYWFSIILQFKINTITYRLLGINNLLQTTRDIQFALNDQ